MSIASRISLIKDHVEDIYNTLDETGNLYILPEEYTQVDYIVANGTQYIDTNYTPIQNDSIEIKNFKPNSIINNPVVFSAGTTDPLFVFLLAETNTIYYKYFASGNVPSVNVDNMTQQEQIVKIDSTGIYFNGIKKGTSIYSGAVNSPLRLFYRANSTGEKYNGRIGRITITNGNITKLDFIPCYRNSDNAVGMYDLVNNVFYINSGTGVFTYGAIDKQLKIPNKNIENINYTLKEQLKYYLINGLDIVWNNWEKVLGNGITFALNNTVKAPMKIELKGNTSQVNSFVPSGYQQVEYIESGGTQYIDTGFAPNNNTRIVADALFNDADTHVKSLFSSVESTWGQSMFVLYSYGNKIQIAYGNKFSPESASKITTRATYDMNKNVLYINDEEIYSLAQQTFTNTKSVLLFARDMSNVFDAYSTTKLYSCQIYDNGTLVRDFIPCYKKSNNTIGLYDIVNNKFYTNKGTGTFTKGADVTLPTPEYPQPIKTVTDYNTIRIVNKNLILNSDSANWTQTKDTNITRGDNFTTDGLIKKLVPGTTLTLSYYLQRTGEYEELTSDFRKNRFGMHGAVNWTNTLGVTTTNYPFSEWITLNNEGSRVSTSWTIPNDCVQINNFALALQIGCRPSSTNDATWILKEPVLEITSTATNDYKSREVQSYPVNLVSKNLFDVSSIVENKWIDENGQTGDSSVTNISNYIEIESNEKYTFSYNYNTLLNQTYRGLCFYDMNKTFVSGTLYNPINKQTSFTAPNNIRYVRFGYDKNCYNVMINKGETALTYEPYFTPIELCKIGTYQDKIAKSTGKNLFDKSTETVGKTISTDTGKVDLDANDRNTSDFIEIKANTNYACSTTMTRIAYYNSSKTFLSSEIVLNSITTPNNASYMRFSYNNSISNVMINEGTTALPYEPYGKVWYLNKQIGKVVLNGSENWSSHQSSNDYISFLKYNPYSIDDNKNNMLCDKFICKRWASSGGLNSEFLWQHATTSMGIVVLKTRLASLDVSGFKTWLSNNNVTLYYVLPTPTYEEITDTTLLSQLNALAYSYDGTTNISQVNDDLPFILDLTALKEMAVTTPLASLSVSRALPISNDTSSVELNEEEAEVNTEPIEENEENISEIKEVNER